MRAPGAALNPSPSMSPCLVVIKTGNFSGLQRPCRMYHQQAVIAEPTTTLTDYAMALQCVAHVVSLRRALIDRGLPPVPAARLYLAGFSTVAVASFAGGTSHGFRGPLGDAWADVWTLTVWSIAVGVALIVAASIWVSARPVDRGPGQVSSGRRWLALGYGITIVGVILLVTKVSFHQHFNHNDLYHVVQMAGLYWVYRGGRRLLALD